MFRKSRVEAHVPARGTNCIRQMSSTAQHSHANTPCPAQPMRCSLHFLSCVCSQPQHTLTTTSPLASTAMSPICPVTPSITHRNSGTRDVLPTVNCLICQRPCKQPPHTAQVKASHHCTGAVAIQCKQWKPATKIACLWLLWVMTAVAFKRAPGAHLHLVAAPQPLCSGTLQTNRHRVANLSKPLALYESKVTLLFVATTCHPSRCETMQP